MVPNDFVWAYRPVHADVEATLLGAWAPEDALQDSLVRSLRRSLKALSFTNAKTNA